MGSLPRLRDGCIIYYVILLCVLTTGYILFFGELRSPRDIYRREYGNLSSRNYEYEEVCREWKVALKEEKSKHNQTTIMKSDNLKTEKVILDGWDYIAQSSHFHCDTRYKYKQLSQRGQYYVIYNFVKAETEFGCIESITLSAPGDYRFLDNVIPLVERWQGPISIALYAPGYDFYTTISAIAYLRNCETYLIRKLVSFHIIFEEEDTPKQRNGSILLNAYEDIYDCTIPPPWKTQGDEEMYKTTKNLLYPINVARNVAKLAAQTYFVFPSDIELYPTRNFIPLFLQFARNNMDLFEEDSRNVFVLPIFEILANQTTPENKTQLLDMLKKKTAIIFHEKVCVVCHRVIESEKWVRTPEAEGLSVFSVGKRTGRHVVWEPFFVCTQKEPLWDERMTWEGQNNKMVQAYTMCVMNYDFHVLDNAFLIHKPGVKKKKVQMLKFNNVVRESTKLIRKIAIELQDVYGYNTNCSTKYKSVMSKKIDKKLKKSKDLVKKVNKD